MANYHYPTNIGTARGLTSLTCHSRSVSNARAVVTIVKLKSLRATHH